MASGFPADLYRLIPALYPHFADILDSTELTGVEFFALSYIKYRGKPLDGGHVAIPVSELKAILLKLGEYNTLSGAAGFIANRLEKRYGFVRSVTLSHKERRDLFADSTGYRDAVVLTDAGHAKLKQVNDLVEQLYHQVSAGTPYLIRQPLLGAFRKAARHLIARLETLSLAKRKRAEG